MLPKSTNLKKELVEHWRLCGRIVDVPLTGVQYFLFICVFFTFQKDQFQSIGKEKLSCMSPELIRAKKVLQSITETRRRCLEELTLRRDFVNWVRESLEGKVEANLMSLFLGINWELHCLCLEKSRLVFAMQSSCQVSTFSVSYAYCIETCEKSFEK